MKIAIASEGNFVSGHFGHCEGFTLYNLAGKEIEKKEFVANPGHKPGFLPVFLSELNVDIIIAGGMGEMAQQLFVENNIKVIVGAEGECDKVIEEYIAGNLQSTGSVCREHQHEGNCGE
ncbi:dinitrogenase iron-molybdenum cofactor [Clostridium acetireducens DSM 10703]|jgi:predicted Fe-Mo cluster-binding NifX family protein|uniref:Dinitrogenase iron-molybdenum cofactor n=1 Tax=Clostridium acetireducens DSM 10703 TaxID=1121290 RepID=A0A1E8F117_9CLOT|nr:NifB/NifX family molybdenum-iron cluster-binding protein [Clostridium acetireducens]OFI07157.1 dinitrogenase iron-molybdenum cofactor [Clostridium acetireducens DSM 10703]